MEEKVNFFYGKPTTSVEKDLNKTEGAVLLELVKKTVEEQFSVAVSIFNKKAEELEEAQRQYNEALEAVNRLDVARFDFDLEMAPRGVTVNTGKTESDYLLEKFDESRQTSYGELKPEFEVYGEKIYPVSWDGIGVGSMVDRDGKHIAWFDVDTSTPYYMRVRRKSF